MRENKTISRSIRMTETVHDYVQRQIGTGFNQKFENCVHRFMWEEGELDRRIKEKKKLLETMEKRIYKVQEVLSSAEGLSRYMESTQQIVSRMVEECNSIAPVAAPAGKRK
jgi:DNA-binding transcriptional regulator GbsR (MarR family)